MIKAICFDLDGVYFTEKGKISFQKSLTKEFRIPEEKVRYIMQKSPEMAKLVRGQISNEEFWNWFRKETDSTLSDAEFTGLWVRDYEIDQNVHSVVRLAKEKGFKTCVCTNNNGIRLPELVKRFKLNEVFDVIISSHEVGECKPDPRIFQALLDGVGVQAGELVYADDNPERLEGARELGMRTFVFTTFDQYLKELRTAGVDLTPEVTEVSKFLK